MEPATTTTRAIAITLWTNISIQVQVRTSWQVDLSNSVGGEDLLACTAVAEFMGLMGCSAIGNCMVAESEDGIRLETELINEALQDLQRKIRLLVDAVYGDHGDHA